MRDVSGGNWAPAVVPLLQSRKLWGTHAKFFPVVRAWVVPPINKKCCLEQRRL